jgi:hypothetical protein
MGTTYFVVGEVVNRGDADAYLVTISAAFYDDGGRLVAARDTLTVLPWTGPGQLNSFKLRLDNAPPGIARYDLSVRWDDVSILDYVRLTLVSQAVRRDEGLFVEGEIRNDYPFDVTGIRVIATFYDERGDVVDLFVGAPDTATLSPGTVSKYIVRVDAPDLVFARVDVQAQGYRAFR